MKKKVSEHLKRGSLVADYNRGIALKMDLVEVDVSKDVCSSGTRYNGRRISSFVHQLLHPLSLDVLVEL